MATSSDDRRSGDSSAPRQGIVARTDRLVLRHYLASDAEILLRQLNEPSFHRYIGDRGVRTAEQARAYLAERIAASYESHGFGMYLVELTDGTSIGMTGLVRRDGLDAPDLGFAFLPEWWGRGYAIEAAAAVLDLAADRFGLERILAITALDNEPSARLLERLDFRSDGPIRLPGGSEELRLWSRSRRATPSG